MKYILLGIAFIALILMSIAVYEHISFATSNKLFEVKSLEEYTARPFGDADYGESYTRRLKADITENEKQIFGDWIILIVLFAGSILGIGLEIFKKDTIGFIGPAFVIILLLTLFVIIAVGQYGDSAVGFLMIPFIAAGIASFLEMWRAGKNGAVKTYMSSVNTHSALVLIIALFATVFVPSGGHPPLPVIIITGPIGIVLLFFWIFLKIRFARNKNDAVTSA